MSEEALEALRQIQLGQMDLHAIENLPRSVMTQLSTLLTPKMTKYIPHVPTPKQSAFMLLDCKEAFYGGAAGGGKSDCLLMMGLQYVDVKGFAGIIFRKSYADLVKPGALIDRSKEWLFQFPDVRWVDKEKKFEFLRKYGPHTEVISILQFGYLENDNDRFNYQGGEYQFVGYDELCHMSEVSYKYMFSRMRRLRGVPIPLRVRGASNPPEDDQGQWIYDRFVNSKTKKPGTVFVSAGLDDNPFLDKKEYIDALNELDPVTRARLKDGIWTITRKGNMFKRGWYEEVDTPPPGRRIVRFWDCAATEVKPNEKKRGKGPDYTVGFKMSEYRGIYYIEDIIHVQKSAMHVEDLQKLTATVDGHRVRIREEEEGGSSGKYAIAKKKREIFTGYAYEGVRSTGSKIERANAVSAASERGVIKVVRGCRNLDKFYDEIEGFPGLLHDDLVDGFSGAFNALGVIQKSHPPIDINSDNSSYWEPESTISDIICDTSSYWRG